MVKGTVNGLIDGAGNNTVSANNPGDVLNLSSRSNIELTINSSTGNTLTYDGPLITFPNIETVTGNGSDSRRYTLHCLSYR